jgi:hydroxyacid-oxoacid transhydrogenase
VESLQASGVSHEVFSDVSVEPTDLSWLKAMEWARKNDFSHFLAYVLFMLSAPVILRLVSSFLCALAYSVGGGSVMDTAKVANL